MRQGKVTFFLATEGKNFGFIDDEVFFHRTRCHTPAFDGGNTVVMNGWWGERRPVVGDIVYLEEEVGPKGKRAKWWCWADEYDTVIKQIAERPTYRMIEHTGPRRNGRLEPMGYMVPRCQWQGNDLRELRIRYGQRYYPLLNNDSMRRWFEVKVEGEWVKCDDPRMPASGS